MTMKKLKDNLALIISILTIASIIGGGFFAALNYTFDLGVAKNNQDNINKKSATLNQQVEELNKKQLELQYEIKIIQKDIKSISDKLDIIIKKRNRLVRK